MENSTATTAKNTSKSDIIIIGAGLSGLTSALKLLSKEPSLSIKILESSSKIGGQIGSNRLGEFGGKWITEDQYHIYKISKELKTPLRRRDVVSEPSKRCWDIDNGIFSIFAKHELSRYIAELDLSCQYFQKGSPNPYLQDGCMRKHINNKLFFQQSRKFLSDIVLLTSGAKAEEISFNDFMTLCYSNGGLKMLMDIYIECPDSLLEISSADLMNVYQEKIKSVEIRLNRKVTEIRHFRDYVEVYDSETEVHTADVVILAIQWNDIDNITFAPDIPKEFRKPPLPADRGKYMITSFQAKYLEGPWREAGYSGNVFLNEPFIIIGHEYRPGTYSGMVIHEGGIEPVLRSITLHALGQKFGDDMLLPIEFTQKTFELSPMDGLPFTTPWNRIVWSSSAVAASCYRGRLGGAVQSGLRAGMNALLILRPQAVAWQDIAEIQGSVSLASSKASRISVWLSSWNLYNFSFYSLLVIGTAVLVRYLYNRVFS